MNLVPLIAALVITLAPASALAGRVVDPLSGNTTLEDPADLAELPISPFAPISLFGIQPAVRGIAPTVAPAPDNFLPKLNLAPQGQPEAEIALRRHSAFSFGAPGAVVDGDAVDLDEVECHQVNCEDDHIVQHWNAVNGELESDRLKTPGNAPDQFPGQGIEQNYPVDSGLTTEPFAKVVWGPVMFIALAFLIVWLVWLPRWVRERREVKDAETRALQNRILMLGME